MTTFPTGNVAFASAPVQLAGCVGRLAQVSEGTNSGLPTIFSEELHRCFEPFRDRRWRFLEVLLFAVQLGYAHAFLDELELFLADGGSLDGQRFNEFLQWAGDLEQQTHQLTDRSFRNAYMRVLRSTWEELQEPWATRGLRATQQKAALWNRHLESTGDPVPLFPDGLFLLHPAFLDRISQAARLGRLRIIPLWAVAFGLYLPVGDELFIGLSQDAMQLMGRLEERSEQLSTRFAALSNKARVQLLFLLSEHVPQTVGDLALQLNLPHSNVSTHLKVLHQAGLVHMERSGVRTLVTRSREAIDALREALKFEL